MEFEEMRKIWDTQNNQPLFVINEAALQRRIQAKANRASRISNMNEIGLTIIFAAVSIILLLIDGDSIFSYITSFCTLLIAAYVWLGRIRRKREAKEFDRTMLGEIDQAIHNITNEINRARNIFWWMFLPAGLPVLINMIYSEVEPWKWVIIPASFVLAYSLVRWEMNKKHLPRKRELEQLREVLVG